MVQKNHLKTELKKDYDKCNANGYFDSFLDNVYGGKMDQKFQKMFDNGSGNELHSKAEAIHSSSMLAYNFFHCISQEHPFRLKGVKYTKVYFEVQMKTLINSNRPANMDVVLLDEENKNIIFIESKFTEYLETKDWRLSDKYTEDNAFNKGIDWKSIIEGFKISINGYRYKEGIKQLTTHLFGIANLCDCEAREWFNEHNKFSIDESLNNYSSVKFINLIFEPQKDVFKKEYESYKCYQSLFKTVQNVIKGKIMIGRNPLEIIWMSYSELWNNKNIEGINKIDKGGLVKYLEKRYMRFAEGAEQ